MKKEQFWNPVFTISLIVSVIIVGLGVVLPEGFASLTSASFDFLVGNFGWFYIITMSSFVVFSLVMLFSKYGDIKLGKPDDKPEYSLMSWFGMLFSAGMGVGLIFFGVAEPLFHFGGPLTGIAPESAAALDFAFRKSFLHWGLHPWAAYAVMALALAYMQFRREETGLISSIFIPLIGREKATGPIGKTIDILAIFATVAGVASSLGMATMQINGGLNGLVGLPFNTGVQLAIIGIITFLFVLTAVMGIEKGIKLVSDMNITLCFGLMLVAFLVGPKVEILNNLSNSVGLYLAGLIPDSFAISGEPWYGWWTVFYWAWWIAWAPFVGTFIARISKGRTIRQFIAGVLIAPTIMSFFWFSIFGTVGVKVYDKIGAFTTETAFFQVFEHYPLGTLLSGVAVLLLTTFFITSANSATFVMGMFSEGGNLNPGTPKKIVWGLVTAGLAAVLLIAGGLNALQTGSIVAAFPFAFVMIAAMVSFAKALKGDAAFIAEQKKVSDKQLG